MKLKEISGQNVDRGKLKENSVKNVDRGKTEVEYC